MHKEASITPQTTVVITDKEWIAIEVEQEKIEFEEIGRFPSLTLSNGTCSGYSSCNRLHGTYTLDGNKITFGAIAVTKMFCMDVKEVEKNYLHALSKVQHWEYKQNQLHFLDENKQVRIVFREKE
jgi:copper homeostasis protein (lipoprotein)